MPEKDGQGIVNSPWNENTSVVEFEFNSPSDPWPEGEYTISVTAQHNIAWADQPAKVEVFDTDGNTSSYEITVPMGEYPHELDAVAHTLPARGPETISTIRAITGDVQLSPDKYLWIEVTISGPSESEEG